MVVTWPKGIKDKGGLRYQFHHLIDIMPTILEVTGISAPTMVNGVSQSPIEGVSMAYTFDSADSPGRRSTQYFEMLGNRAIYSEGWMACVFHGRAPWDFNTAPSFDNEQWELYDLEKDFSQFEDLAAVYPEKLEELKALFDEQARQYNIYPLDDRGIMRRNIDNLPRIVTQLPAATYYPGAIRIPESSAPDTKNRSFSLTADVILPEGGANGVIAAIGGVTAGWSLYFQNSRPVFVYNYFNSSVPTIQGAEIEPGPHRVLFEFAYDGGGMGKGGTGTIKVDGRVVGEGRIEKTVPGMYTPEETFDIGMDLGTPVGAYKAPFKFNGTIKKVTLDASPNAIKAE
jgi:arylsulfatase